MTDANTNLNQILSETLSEDEKTKQKKTAAPDRAVRRDVGKMDCHYALLGNLGEDTVVSGVVAKAKHSEQQDRASIIGLPETFSEEFEKLMRESFKRMSASLQHAKQQRIDAKKPEFAGDACVTMMMFDPVKGKLAIGSKGDAPVYVVMQHKISHKSFIQRISSPNQKAHQALEGGKVHIKPNSLGMPYAVMWAGKDSWKNKNSYFDDLNVKPEFELIDFKQLCTDIVHEDMKANMPKKKAGGWFSKPKEEELPQVHLNDYNISLVMGSDGLTDGKFEMNNDNKKGVEGRLQDICDTALEKSDNNAELLLQRLSSRELKECRSKDNMSVIMLRNIRFGTGEAVAACVADGNYNHNVERMHDGAWAAEMAIQSFESVIGKERPKEPKVDEAGKGPQASKITANPSSPNRAK